MKKVIFGLVLGVSSLGITSCELNSPKYEEPPQEVVYYSANRYSHAMFFDVVKQAMEITKLQVDNPTGNKFPAGVTVTPVLEEGKLVSLTVEYSEINGRVGKLEISYSGIPFAEGSSMLIKPMDLTYHPGIKVEGPIKLDFKAKGDAKNKFTIFIEKGILTDKVGAMINYGCNLSCEQKEGKVAETSDDTFTFTGSEYGVFVNKVSYNLTIANPIVYTYTSPYASEGKVTMTPSGYTDSFSIEFGKGNALNHVYLTYKDKSGLYYI